MMENLPVETFLYITSFLPTIDKLSCIRVCRKWYEIITENNLYINLEFSEQNKLIQALDLFHRCPDMRRTVTKLVFTGPEVEIEDIVWLPHLFPKVKSFTNHREKLLTSFSAQYQSVFEAWSHLEYLEDSSKELYLANTILQSGLYNYLKTIEINFHNLKPTVARDGSITSHSAFKTLLRNLQHAPRLEVFTAHHGFIDLSDMELLHTNAPNLRELNMTNVEFENGTMENRVLATTITPVNKLRKLHFREIRTGFAFDQDLRSTSAWQYIANWFSYFSQKYIFVEDCLIEPFRWDDGLIMPEMLIQPLQHLVSCLPRLKSYGMKLYPLTSNVLNAMDENGVKLEKLRLWMWTPPEVDEQFETLAYSSQAEYIKELVISNPEAIEWPGDLAFELPNLCDYLFDLCDNMPQLTHLTIETGGKYSRILFQSIFQYLPQLQTLEFRTIRVGYLDDEEDYTDAPTECQLKHLDFKVSQSDEGHKKDSEILRDINASIKFALESCPDLETFKMGGAVRRVKSGEIYLDFTNNRKLKRIDINFFDFEFCNCRTAHPAPRKIKAKKNTRVVHVLCDKSVDLELEKRDYMDFDIY